MPASKCDGDTGYPEAHSGFPLSVQADSSAVPYIRPMLLYSTLFPINYLTTQCYVVEILTASLNKAQIQPLNHPLSCSYILAPSFFHLTTLSLIHPPAPTFTHSIAKPTTPSLTQSVPVSRSSSSSTT
jgi:hypothetical protein